MVCLHFVHHIRYKDTGDGRERVSNSGKTFVTWVAHYQHGRIAEEVAKVRPADKKRRGPREEEQPEVATAL